MDKYQSLARHYENCLEKFGDTSRGVDWPNQNDAATRYDVMLNIIPRLYESTPTLLDFGCGKADLLTHIKRKGLTNINYTGLDISDKFISFAKQKYPIASFIQADILNDNYQIPEFDYIVANGVFTIKNEIPYAEMLAFMEKVLVTLFRSARIGLAFNVMSTQVDWQRDDLFHVDLNTIASLIYSKMSRHFEIKHHYGLYEYTTYVYKAPQKRI